jgi:hypothetical protein
MPKLQDSIPKYQDEPTLVTSAGCRYAKLDHLMRIRPHVHATNPVPNTLLFRRALVVKMAVGVSLSRDMSLRNTLAVPT